jgi:uncharacterized protein YqgV (UPF0045/DUF77 family)
MCWPVAPSRQRADHATCRGTLCHVRLVAEFTTEPFHGEGEPPPHAQRAWEVIQAAGLTGDFGPLGTQFAGPADDLLDTLRTVLAEAFAAGATRVTVQVTPEG